METFENYTDIINSLKTLRGVKPDSTLQNRLRSTLTQKNARPFFSPFRVALSALVILFFAGGSAALASDSKPGAFLYPVKRAIISLVDEVTRKPEETKPLPLSSSQAITPTPTTQPMEEPTRVISQQSTPTPTTKPSVAIPPGQSIQATTEVNKGQMIKQTLGVGATISIATQNEITPTQKPEEGNSNTSSNKEKSMLPIQPKIEINLKEKPVIHIGL